MLRGRQFLAAEIPGVGTTGLPLIIAEMHSQEYNVYFRAMRQRPAAPDPMGNQGQSGFSLLSFREWALSS